MNLERAQPFDLSEIQRLLINDGLPIADLTIQSLDHFTVLRDGQRVVGVVGLEHRGVNVLLRSLVVSPDHRGHGFGLRLLMAAESQSRALGAQAIYLLTTSAAHFFSARGFHVVSRGEVPEEIRRTTEFSSLCPASATVMVKR